MLMVLSPKARSSTLAKGRGASARARTEGRRDEQAPATAPAAAVRRHQVEHVLHQLPTSIMLSCERAAHSDGGIANGLCQTSLRPPRP
jgi:hypothetical protein